jgi:putative PEP-CTERM system TPR-repeat lipoprotein
MQIRLAAERGSATGKTVVRRSAGKSTIPILLAALVLAALAILMPPTAEAASFLERAQQHFEEGDLRAAEIELKNALQREPDNAEARLLRGKVLFRMGDAKAAETELLRARQLGFDSDELQLLLARTRLKLQRFSDVARGIPEDLVIESDLQRDLYVARGEALMGMGQFDEALAIFDRVLQDELHASALANKARIAAALGDMAEARSLLDQALAADPENELAVATDAVWQLRTRQFEAAKTAYARAIEINPTDLLSQVGLIQAHIALGELDEAADIVQSIKERQPDIPLIVLQDSIVLFLQHNYRAAKTQAERLLAISQNLPQALLISGYSAFQLQEYERARSNLSIYLTQRPQDDDVRAVLGAALLKLGYKQEAYSLMTAPGEDVPDTTAYLSILTSAAAGVNDQPATLRYLKRLALKVPDDARIQERLGLALLEGGETEEGITTLNRTLQLNPRSERAYSHLFAIYVQQANYEAALQLAQQMQDTFPDASVGHTLEGIVLINKGNQAGAEAALRRALEKQPGSPDAVRNLAQLLLADNRVDDARQVFDSAVAHASGAWPLLFNYALLEREVGNETRAQALLRQAMASNPDAWQIRSLLALSLLQTGDVGEALTMGRSALADNPNNPQLQKTVSLALLQSGSPAEALDLLNRVVAATPNDARAHENRSLALEQAGRIEEAEAALQEAMKIEPENSDLQLARASLLLKLGHSEEAKGMIPALKQSLPDDERVMIIEGRIALLENNTDDAVTAFESALAKSGSNLVLLDLVQALFKADRGDEALNTMQGWLAEHSDDWLVRHRQAEYFMALQRWGEAESSYETMLARQPNDARALNNLAWIKLELGKPESALAAARKAATLAPQNATVSDTLATALLRSGQQQEAINLLKSVTKSAPNDKTLRYRLAQALSTAGQVEEAVSELQAILDDTTPFREREDAEALLSSLTQ